MKTEPNESIKPLTGSAGYPLDKSEVYNEPNEKMCIGLTKREYFAALIIQGLSANTDWSNNSAKEIARTAVVTADALIDRLNQ